MMRVKRSEGTEFEPFSEMSICIVTSLFAARDIFMEMTFFLCVTVWYIYLLFYNNIISLKNKNKKWNWEVRDNIF